MDSISIAIGTVKILLPSIDFSLNESLKDHTSFKIGGPARVMFFPKTSDEFVEIFSLLDKHDIAPLIIGNGTNILADDSKPLDIAVIKTTGISAAELTGESEITAGAGISLMKLAQFAYEHGLAGLEFTYGIPGTLGGAASMNAGAYGGEMSDVIYSTNAFAKGSGLYAITGDEHDFSYRHSRFSDKSDIVLSAVIRLQKGEEKNIKAKMDELIGRRRESQPLDIPSAGSTFKRPKDGYAASLIERAGLKGFTIGGAQVSQKHSGFIVNTGGATYEDVIAIIEHVKETVYKRFGIELEPEIKIIRS